MLFDIQATHDLNYAIGSDSFFVFERLLSDNK